MFYIYVLILSDILIVPTRTNILNISSPIYPHIMDTAKDTVKLWIASVISIAAWKADIQ